MSSCNSNVGRVRGFQGDVHYVSLSSKDGCVAKTVVIHEVMHVIGFEHEHRRPDRDKYVKIYNSNIQPSRLFYFQFQIFYSIFLKINKRINADYQFAYAKTDASEYKIINSYDYGTQMNVSQSIKIR